MKDFFRFSWTKILLFLVPLFIHFYYIFTRGVVKCTVHDSWSYSKIMIECLYGNIFLFIVGVFVSPIFYLYGIFLFSHPLPASLVWPAYIFIFFLQAAYWYLLACIVSWLFSKFSKKNVNV